MSTQEILSGTRVPQAYGYARVSDFRQAEHGESIVGQSERIKHYFDSRFATANVEWRGMEFDSFGVSGFKRPFFQRPAGIRLANALREGDHVLFDKVDRIARKMKYFVSFMEWCKNHGIHVHITSLSIDTSAPYGTMIMQIFQSLAELDARLRSERAKEYYAYAAQTGRACSKPPLGVKHVKRRGGRQYRVWNADERAIMNQIVTFRRQGKSFGKISELIETQLAARNGRQFSKSAFYKRRWTTVLCYKAFCVEVFYQDNGIHDPKDIPTGYRKRAVEYCKKIGLVTHYERRN